MATPVSSPYSTLNLNAKSYEIAIGPGSLSDPSSLCGQYPPTPPEVSYSSANSPYQHQNKDRSSSNGSLSSYSYNKKSSRHSGKKQLYLDISGPFPYFDEELKEEKEPESDTESNERELTKQEISKLEKQTLSQHGYIRTKYIATTLQGEVFHGQSTTTQKEVVIKKTSKKLHKLGITITKSGKVIKVKENIIEEAELMQKFSNNSPPSSLIEYHDFFQDSHYYYLVMENGGSDYFDFVVKCHDLITQNKLKLSEWRKHCKFMFAQMIQFLRWMHKKMNCCYLDISLENMLIKNSVQINEDTGKLSGCYIKFIDFGLTQFFDPLQNPHCLCQKYVGKTHYKAPKVYGKKETFCADKADIWSLGVCLFMMVVGAPPYNKPSEKDVTYQYVKHKQIAKLLSEWGRMKYVTSNLHDLLTKMLTFDESQRITLDEIVCHPWIKHYFPKENQPTPNPTVISPAACAAAMFGNCDINNIPQTDDELPPNTPQMIAAPASASLSIQTYPYNNGNINMNQKVNAMIPQQCISYSVSRKSVSHRESSYLYSPNNRHRYSTPYTPYSPYPCTSPLSPNGHRNIIQNTPTPTPIIQSHTSQHDHNFYYAAIDDKQKRKSRTTPKRKKNKKSAKLRSKSVGTNNKHKKKKEKKTKKNFFKLFG